MPNKNRKIHSGIKMSKFGVLLLLFILFVILIFIIALVLNQYGINLLNLGNSNHGSATWNFLEDRCSYIAGQLIHTINNVNECELRCRSVCYSLGSSYQQANFTQTNGTCNLCYCLCN